MWQRDQESIRKILVSERWHLRNGHVVREVWLGVVFGVS